MAKLSRPRRSIAASMRRKAAEKTFCHAQAQGRRVGARLGEYALRRNRWQVIQDAHLAAQQAVALGVNAAHRITVVLGRGLHDPEHRLDNGSVRFGLDRLLH
ncbi:MAG: hypothetical protein L0H63_11195 [Nitrococcus sp.]|nr:hypothetical protein [Nitrococcus sp.]